MIWLVITDIPTADKARRVYANTDDDRQRLSVLRTKYPDARVWRASSRTKGRAMAVATSEDLRAAGEEEMSRVALDGHAATPATVQPTKGDSAGALRGSRERIEAANGMTINSLVMQREYGITSQDVHTIDLIIGAASNPWPLDDFTLALFEEVRREHGHGNGKIRAIQYLRQVAVRGPVAGWCPEVFSQGTTLPAMLSLREAKSAVETRMERLAAACQCFTWIEIAAGSGGEE